MGSRGWRAASPMALSPVTLVVAAAHATTIRTPLVLPLVSDKSMALDWPQRAPHL